MTATGIYCPHMPDPARYLPRPARILIIKPSSLGDIVHALPVLAALRARHPRARIAWLAGESFAPLLEGHPLLDDVIRFDRRRFGRMLQSPRIFWEFLRFVADLRRRRFDLVIDLQGLVRSGFLAFASGARERIGFAKARELAGAFYSRRVRCPADDVHAVDRNLCVAAALGLPADTPGFPLALRPDEHAQARALLADVGTRPLERFTAVLPGARWPSKQWPAQHWAGLLARLAQEDLPPAVLLGGPGDLPVLQAIQGACPVPLLSLVGRTSLRQLTALLARAELVICCDSGPMHLAAALGRPLVALFGPTNPQRTGPYGRAARVVSLSVPCAPCYARTCPLQHHDCLERLSIERVIAEVRKLRASLSSEPGAGPARGHAPSAAAARSVNL